MTNEQRLDELLLEWQELRERGRGVQPGDLCQDDPELLPAFEKQVAAILSMDRFIKPPAPTLSAIAHWGIPIVQEIDPDTVEETDEHNQSDTTEPCVSVTVAGGPDVPGYRMLAEIARGGMGRVYAGYDLTLEREVAIKTLLPGAGAERFVMEAKITARLPHPGIPPVHELGTLEDGTPYLVMKLIRGRTFAEMLKARATPAEDLPRLVQIFEQIAQAVGFAHSRGIIHRDLKPLNVMVGEFGEVQVMDWGLGRELRNADCGLRNEEPPGTHADLTRVGVIMGTPGYMAPEQARGEPLDARADVFALGSMLATVLTGQPAFVGNTMQETIDKAATADLADVLARLDACGAEQELLTLAKKCLTADSGKRLPDARQVAAEVAAYRAGVEARLRQVETEKAEALVREAEQHKRRGQFVAAVAVVLATLTIGLAASLWQMQRAIGAEKSAKAERDAKGRALDAETAARLAETAAKQDADEKRRAAEKRLVQIEKGIELYAGMLGGINPRAEEQGGDPLYVQLRQRAERAADQLDAESVGDPLAVARLQSILGNTLKELGNAAKAVELLEKARSVREQKLGADNPDTLLSINNLALAYQEAGRRDLALPLLERILEILAPKFGADHLDTLTTMHNLAMSYLAAGKLDLALPLLKETYDRMKAKLGADDPVTLSFMGNLASGYHAAGKLNLAVPLYEETFMLKKSKLGPDHPDTLVSMDKLAQGYQAAGKVELALPLFAEALELRKAKLGVDHPATLASMNNLATGYLDARKPKLALPLFEVAHNLRKSKLGADHPTTIKSMGNLAEGYRAAGKLDLALPLLEETLERTKSQLGADHPDTLTSMNNLAAGYHEAGKPDLAVRLFEETLELTKSKLGHDHPDTLTSMHNLAAGYRAAGKLELALPLWEEALGLLKSKLGADHPDTINSMTRLAEGYSAARKPELAGPLWEEIMGLLKSKQGADHPDTLDCMNRLAAVYFAARKLDLAVPLFEETLRLRKSRLGADHPDAISSLYNLAIAYCEAQLGDEAVPLFAEYFEQRRKRLTPGDAQRASAFQAELVVVAQKLQGVGQLSAAEAYLREALDMPQTSPAWIKFHLQSLLGDCLAAQGNYAHSEPLLLAGYAGLKDREEAMPTLSKTRIPEAIDRLVEFYTATDKPDELAKWQAERAKYPQDLSRPPK